MARRRTEALRHGAYVALDSPKLLGLLRNLRSAGLPPGLKDHAALMEHTLGCICDTEEELSQRLHELQGALGALDELMGPAAIAGARQATAAVSRRAVQVVERKLGLLADVNRRVNAFKELSAKKVEVLRRAAAGGDVDAIVGTAADLLQHVQRATHKGGNPEDASKVQFERFVTTFGMPRDHLSLRGAHELLRREEPLWGEAVLEEAERVASFFRQRDACDDVPARSVRRMIDTAVLLGVRRDEDHISKAWLAAMSLRKLALQRLVRRESRASAPAPVHGEGPAEARPHADAVAAATREMWAGALGASSAASKAAARSSEERAARIETELRRALEFGLPECQVQEERRAAEDLRSEWVSWLAIAETATAGLAGAAQLDAEPCSPRSLLRQREAANRVVEACKVAVGLGVSWDHPNLQQAWNIAETVIADVGFQKRLSVSEAALQRRQEASTSDVPAEAASQGRPSHDPARRRGVLAEMRARLLGSVRLMRPAAHGSGMEKAEPESPPPLWMRSAITL